MPALEVLGYRSWVSAEPEAGDSRSVTLLAGPRAGDVRVRAASAMHLAHLEATGGLLGARTLYAVHTAAPIGRRLTAQWSHDLEVLGHWCAAPVAPIVAGDLNATLDHGPLRAALGGCRSAAGAAARTRRHVPDPAAPAAGHPDRSHTDPGRRLDQPVRGRRAGRK